RSYPACPRPLVPFTSNHFGVLASNDTCTLNTMCWATSKHIQPQFRFSFWFCGCEKGHLLGCPPFNLFLVGVRRCPTFPPGLGSLIGLGRLSFRVRNGSGRFPAAVTTVTLITIPLL